MREQLTMDRIYGNEIASLTEPHLACALLLDTSGSMQGAPIRSLNESIQQFKATIMADPIARKRVEIAIITFDSKVTVVNDFCPIDKMPTPNLDAYGFTEMGQGILKAVEMVKSNDYDLIVMDIMMPKLDGFSTCKEIKKYKTIPVIMLSARGEEYDKLFGFELGIDDYVVKPFSPKELMARIKAVLKRNTVAETAVPEKIKFEGLEIDLAGREVYVDGQKASMTPKEYDLLFYLVKNKNLALTRDKLLEEVWGYDFFGDDRTVDTHIKMLRNSLGPYRKFIVTLRGMGYKFEYTQN